MVCYDWCSQSSNCSEGSLNIPKSVSTNVTIAYSTSMLSNSEDRMVIGS